MSLLKIKQYFCFSFNLGIKANNKAAGRTSPIVSPSCKLPIVVQSLSSYSIFSDYAVWIMNNGQGYAIGNTEKNRIGYKTPIDKLTSNIEIIIQNKKGHLCKFYSAVCGNNYTLYLTLDCSQLIISYYNHETLFLNINGRKIKALFGGCLSCAAIGTEGENYLITEAIYALPNATINPIFLPENEKSVKIACLQYSFIFLSSSGRVFEFNVKNSKFVEFPELKNETIVDISGTFDSCLLINKEGKVFGRGDNSHCKLGMPKDTKSVSTFTLIKSLDKYKIVFACTSSYHSLFITSDNKLIGCGENSYGEVMMKSGPTKDDVYPPVEIPVQGKISSCIAGQRLSVLFVDTELPPNMPNMKIELDNSVKSLKKEMEGLSKIEQLQKELDNAKKEIELLHQKEKDYLKQIQDLQKQLDDSKSAKGANEGKNHPFEIFDVETLDNFERVKKLGRGATSEVYQVKRSELAALKIFDVELFNPDDDEDDDKEISIDVERLKRFLLEYEVLNKLDHPNIIKAFGFCFGDAKHPPAILLEYCPSNLKKKVKKLTKEQKILIIIEICSAMKKVHSVKIIHRDLKMENILLDKDNHVKLSDFGLCTIIDNESESFTRTQMAGTLKFMAPELVQGRTDYNEKVDIYAFGVVVYLVLNQGEYPQISLADVGNGIIPQIPDSFTKFSKSLIEKCWSKNAADRPSFDEIFDLLKANENNIV